MLWKDRNAEDAHRKRIYKIECPLFRLICLPKEANEVSMTLNVAKLMRVRLGEGMPKKKCKQNYLNKFNITIHVDVWRTDWKVDYFGDEDANWVYKNSDVIASVSLQVFYGKYTVKYRHFEESTGVPAYILSTLGAIHSTHTNTVHQERKRQNRQPNVTIR